MPVIALTQEMGSLAKDVALLLEQEGKLKGMRHEVLEGVAGSMHVSTSVISRLREGKAGFAERMRIDRDRMAVYTAKEVFALAEQGNIVLRGWGVTCLLRPVAHVLRVRITRPFEQRVQWLMDHLQITDEDFAREEVRRSDHAHASRMHALFNVTWGDPLLYDVVLNTDRISVESCAALILQLAQRPEFQETEASRATLAGLALSAAVRSALKDHGATHEVNIEIQANGGNVALRGIVLNEQERDDAARIASTVAGVDHVDNQLRVMSVYPRFTHVPT